MSGRTQEPANLNDVIWRLMNGGHGVTSIREVLASGDSELGRPFDRSVRTIARRVRDLREERGEPLQHVPEGQVTATLDAVERSIIATARTETARIQGKQRTGPLSPNDITALERLAKTVRQLKAPAGASRTSQRGTREPDQPSSALDEITMPEPASTGSPLSEGEANGVNGTRGARQQAAEERAAIAPR